MRSTVRGRQRRLSRSRSGWLTLLNGTGAAGWPWALGALRLRRPLLVRRCRHSSCATVILQKLPHTLSLLAEEAALSHAGG